MKIIAVLLVVALAFAIVAVLRNHGRCGNCKFYDKTLRICWPRFEERFEGDKGCVFFKKREDEK